MTENLKRTCTVLLALLTVPFFIFAQKYRDTDLSPAERAADLVSHLTLQQKVALMQNSSPAIPELGIKEYDWWNEALHGVGRAGLATVFPQAVGMAASFNDSLLLDVFTAVSDEARAKSAVFSANGGLKRYQGLTFWTPNVNIFRDPRWGRGQETYGEDPYLTSRMGVSVVNGLQGPAGSKYDKLHACAKHYAVHSGPEWNRHSFNAEDIDPRDLWETYLPAFKALVQEAGVKEVMCAYNRYEGDPCCGSDRLLQQILRKEWGFDGIVLSDCWAINNFYTRGQHFTEPDAQHASSKAVLSGTDLECGSSYASLVKGVAEGLIKESDIDIAITRLMKARFELGEMDSDVEWNNIPYSVVDSREHRALALKMAQQSMVLLKNNGILPLAVDTRLAVMGPNANDSVMQWGNYSGTPSRTVTMLDGLQRRFGKLIYERGCDHAASTFSILSLFDHCSAGNTQGFDARYWNNRLMQGEPDVLRHNATPLQFTTAGATVFAPNVNLTDFSAEYTSVFKATEDGDIAFYCQCDGTASLFIDGRPAAVARSGGESRRLYTLKASAGKEYSIRLTYTSPRGGGDASLRFDLGYEVEINPESSIAKLGEAQVVVFAGGISPSLEGEEMPVSIEGFKGGDRTLIELPRVQVDFVKALKAAGKKVVFVNFSGSAIALTAIEEYCDAILQAWYPGEEGGNAIASVLSGEYNPAGRLPVTFYASTDQLPDFEDYSMRNRTYRYFTGTPEFPFGYGLGYSEFVYGKGSLSSKSISADGGSLTLTIPVRNSGKRDGDEVVQIYVRRVGDQEGPLRALRAFKRVNVPAGRQVRVQFSLQPETFLWFDNTTGTMRVVPGQYELLYGPSSDISTLKVLPVTVN